MIEKNLKTLEFMNLILELRESPRMLRADRAYTPRGIFDEEHKQTFREF